VGHACTTLCSHSPGSTCTAIICNDLHSHSLYQPAQPLCINLQSHSQLSTCTANLYRFTEPLSVSTCTATLSTNLHGHSPAEDGRFLHQDVEVVFAAHLAVPLMHRAFKAPGSFAGHLEHRGRDTVTRCAMFLPTNFTRA
jgi:hypothetical protein